MLQAQLMRKYKVPCDFLFYNGLRSSIPRKYQLNTWNIEDSNKCTYCQEIDTLSHYFVECESMRGFWNSLKGLVSTYFRVLH